MKIQQKFLSGLTSAVVGLSASVTLGSAALAADFTMKFAGGQQNEPMHEYMKLYKECLETASNGRIDVKLFIGTQLGGLAAQIQGLQAGTIETAIFAGQHMKGVEKKFAVVDAPGLFEGFEHANASYWAPEFRERYLMAARDKGVLGVGIFAYGPTSFQTIDPVKSLSDFKGMKLRILASDIERKLTDALAATGLQVDWPDILPAMQRGQIDGLHSNIVLANAYKFYTVSEHTTSTNTSMIPVVQFVSARFFDSLPTDLQDAVQACGREVEQKAEPIAKAFTAKAEKEWKAAGGQIHVLSDAEAQKLKEIAEGIGDEVYASDPDMKELYEALKTAAEQHHQS